MTKRNHKCHKCSPNGGAIADKVATISDDGAYGRAWHCRNCHHEQPIKRRHSAKREARQQQLTAIMEMLGQEAAAQ